MSKNLVQLTENDERLLTEMKEHGGEFVALDSQDVAIVYAATEEGLVLKLQAMGLRRSDVCVSRIMEYGVSYMS